MIRPPVDTSMVAEHTYITCDLIRFHADGESCSPRVWNQAGSVGRGLDRIEDRQLFVEKCFNNRGTGAGDRGMTRTVGRVLWTTFGKCHRQEVTAVLVEDQRKGI